MKKKTNEESHRTLSLSLPPDVVDAPPPHSLFHLPTAASRYFSIRLDQSSGSNRCAASAFMWWTLAKMWACSLQLVLKKSGHRLLKRLHIFRELYGLVQVPARRGEDFSGQLKAVPLNFGEAAKQELPFAR